MNESVTNPQERPSILGSFFKGAMSSAISGAMMAGIVALVGPLFGAAALGWGGALLMFTATGLFGGVMGVKRAMFDSPSAGSSQSTFIPIPVGGVSGPAVSIPSVSADMAAEQDQPTKNWVADTAREGDAKQRIQQIIASGRMADQDRASAILAAREAAAANDNGRNV
ncbi:MAG: hypothetical protein K2X09_07530 [Rickettsiales bacterium]|nr:hypothetical protein [Rickettsiales bacterium]